MRSEVEEGFLVALCVQAVDNPHPEKEEDWNEAPTGDEGAKASIEVGQSSATATASHDCLGVSPNMDIILYLC